MRVMAPFSITVIIVWQLDSHVLASHVACTPLVCYTACSAAWQLSQTYGSCRSNWSVVEMSGVRQRRYQLIMCLLVFANQCVSSLGQGAEYVGISGGEESMQLVSWKFVVVWTLQLSPWTMPSCTLPLQTCLDLDSYMRGSESCIWLGTVLEKVFQPAGALAAF